MLLSIIVPVYNVDKYLQRCIESVAQQIDVDMEMILVNDGSTDKSGELCDEFAMKYKFIKVIHKNNGGLSDARNVGILQAKGKYISFLDSDDAYLKKSICNIKNIINDKEPQVIIGFFANSTAENVETISKCDVDIAKIDLKAEDRCSVLKELMNVNISPAAWRYVVMRDFLLEHNLFFKKNILCEDAFWTPRLLLACEKFAFNGEPFYHYFERPQSIMTTFNFKRYTDVLDICKEQYRFVENGSQIEKNFMYKFLAKIFVFNIKDYFEFNSEQKTYVKKWCKDNRDLTRNILFFKKPMYYFSKIIGPINTVCFLSFLNKFYY